MTVLDEARQGQVGAIAQLLNRSLIPKQIIAKVSRTQTQLTIFADSATLPNRESLVGVIRRGIQDLHVEGIQTVKIYGRQIGDASATWIENVVLVNAPPPSRRQSSSGEPLGEQIQEFAGAVVNRLKLLVGSKLFRRGAVSFALLVVLGIAGTLGYGFYTYRSAQATTIATAQTHIEESQDVINPGEWLLWADLSEFAEP